MSETFSCPWCDSEFILVGNLFNQLCQTLVCPHCGKPYQLHYETLNIDDDGYFYVEKETE